MAKHDRADAVKSNPAQRTSFVADTVSINLTQDELEMLVDGLEADMEGYVEAAKEARGNTRRDEVATYTEAATRIQALLTRLQALIED